MQKAAREATRLDPRQSLAYASLAAIEINREHWAAAEYLLRKALDVDPYEPDVLFRLGDFLHQTGRAKGSSSWACCRTRKESFMRCDSDA
jgi:Tfp pilus assembly protein PilF